MHVHSVRHTTSPHASLRHATRDLPSVRVTLGLCMLGLALAGCVPPPAKPPAVPTTEEKTAAYAKALERLYARYEAYGTIVMSNPLLSRPGDGFTFDLTAAHSGADNYYKAAREEVQGGARELDQVATAFGLNLGLSENPVAKDAYRAKVADYLDDKARIRERDAMLRSAADVEYASALEAASRLEDKTGRDAAIVTAKQKYAASLPKPTSDTPAYPDSAGTTASPPAGKSDANAKNSASDALIKADGLGKLPLALGTPAPKVTPRSALITAAGDKAVEAIFRLLGQPDRADTFRGSPVMMAVAQVTLMPGQRTESGYAAQLSAQVSLTDRDARPDVVQAFLRDVAACRGARHAVLDTACAQALKAVRPNDFKSSPMAWDVTKAPGAVVAVSPMTDVQTLDLATGMRRRSEFSLSLGYALAAAGKKVEAGAFFDYAKQLERDAVSRTVDVPIVSYATGFAFGFQVGPNFRAINDLTAKRFAAGYRLTRQSFPVLLLFNFSTDDIRPFVVCDASPGQGAGTQCTVIERHVEVTQVPEWIPGGTGKSYTNEARTLSAERLADTMRLREARAALCPHLAGRSDAREVARVSDAIEDSPFCRPLEARTLALRHFLSGSSYHQAVPLDILLGTLEPRAIPRLALAVPDRLDPARDTAGRVIPGDQAVTLLGQNVDALDPASAQIVAGDATHVASSVADGALRVQLRVVSDTAPIVISYRRRGAMPGEDVLVSPPISFAPAPSRPVVLHQMLPSAVVLETDCGTKNPIGTNVVWTVLGDNLDAVDRTSVRMLSGRGTVDAGSVVLVGGGSGGKGGALQWRTTVESAEAPVAFSIDTLAGPQRSAARMVTPPAALSTVNHCPKAP